jgi:hypothetical protein
MRHDQLDVRDHHRHHLRNRALQRVLDSILRVQVSRAHAKQARRLARRAPGNPWDAEPAARTPTGRVLRLVKS